MSRAAAMAAVVCGVAARAMEDAGATRIALVADGSPEAALAAEWLGGGLGATAVIRAGPAATELESLLRSAAPTAAPARLRLEAVRTLARLVDDALPAFAANRTALLLGGRLPPEPFLPLGDVYASEVASLAGEWSAPEAVVELAAAAGGIARLDEALRELLERRNPRGLEGLPEQVRPRVRALLARGRASRSWQPIVPKLGRRTIGLDLRE